MVKWRDLGDDYPGVRIQVAPVGGRLRIVGIQVQNPEGVLHDQIRSVPVAQLEAALNETQPSGVHWVLPEAGSWPAPKPQDLYLRDEYFENPDGRGYGHELYERVALLYTRCVAGGVPPAPAIAEANEAHDVSVSQVHRWIREARRRGVLAPARGPGAQG
jgi:hypothetical protein